MPDEKIKEGDVERPDSWWYRVYIAVALFTVLVISGLAWFTHYFSS